MLEDSLCEEHIIVSHWLCMCQCVYYTYMYVEVCGTVIHTSITLSQCMNDIHIKTEYSRAALLLDTVCSHILSGIAKVVPSSNGCPYTHSNQNYCRKETLFT